MMVRVISWFSCGAASAYATYLAAQKYDDLKIVYCRVRQEHEDNMDFIRQYERQTNLKVEIIENQEFEGDIYAVFRKRKFIKNQYGAPCTMLLKKEMRYQYQQPGDTHIFGFPVEEEQRSLDLLDNEPDLIIDNILIDQKISKADCKDWLSARGFELPRMYQLGYKNNNCIGCVKGGMGYWNAIRVDFPDAFQKMATLEREIGHAVNKDDNGAVYLDELDPKRGNFKRDLPGACGLFCDYKNPLTEQPK